MKNYQELFQKSNINTTEAKQALRYLGYAKTYKKIINTAIGILWVLAILSYIMGDGSGSSRAGVFGVIGALTMFIYVPLLTLYLLYRNYIIGRLEQIYFDEFLCKKLKIFYSPNELNNFEYTTLKEATVTANQNNNQRQALILICTQAYEEGAEGVLILNSDNSSVTTGKIGKKGGNVRTDFVGTVSARFISNIKEKNSKENDLTYWFGLFERGAITKDEYEAKKKELI
ncbi:SHOCT domain-containing protein [Sulfurimonas sp.]|uniref:SHOCT domain-containing protein n=1 Tax=Sulfurimonas sp. TaxID=2022749 RepID=UPI003D0C72C7